MIVSSFCKQSIVSVISSWLPKNLSQIDLKAFYFFCNNQCESQNPCLRSSLKILNGTCHFVSPPTSYESLFSTSTLHFKLKKLKTPYIYCGCFIMEFRCPSLPCPPQVRGWRHMTFQTMLHSHIRCQNLLCKSRD